MDLSIMTKTPLSYRDRNTFEFVVLGTCALFNALFCLFFISRPHFLYTFKPTICFVTFGNFFFSLFIIGYQLFLGANLWSEMEPNYSVATCTILKCLVSAMTSSSQVLPLPVAIYRYFLVVWNKNLSFNSIIFTQLLISLIFISIAFLHLPLGEIKKNDQCELLQFSVLMEVLRITLTLGFNVFAVLINFYICLFVKKHENSQNDIHSRRVQLTYSLLIQSLIPILVSIPLLAGSFNFYFGFDLPYNFVSRYYVTSFLSPLLTPISSMLSLKSIRVEMFDIFLKRRSTASHKISTVGH